MVLAAGEPGFPDTLEPYCGERMLRLNDLHGSKHMTYSERSFTLDRDLPCGGRLRFRWLLEEHLIFFLSHLIGGHYSRFLLKSRNPQQMHQPLIREDRITSPYPVLPTRP